MAIGFVSIGAIFQACRTWYSPGARKVIFVHGCFWHQHDAEGCWRSRLPKSRPEFWIPKLRANVARDMKVLDSLRAARWEVLVIWECETIPSRRRVLEQRLVDFLGISGAGTRATAPDRGSPE